MSSATTAWALAQTAGGPVEKLALVLMADGVDMDGRYTSSLARLAERMEVPRLALDMAIDRLAERGLVRRDGTVIALMGAPT